MDIVLVKPNNQKKLYQDLSKDFTGKEPPLWLILTAAYLREKGFSVQVIDAEAENFDVPETAKKIVALNPLLVGVVLSGSNPSASTMSMPGASNLAKELKAIAPGVATVMSGLHTSALPEQTLTAEQVDFIFQGEGFTTYEDLLTALKAGKTKEDEFKIDGLWHKRDGNVYSNPRPKNIEDLGSLPMPAWDLLSMDKYRAHNWHCFQHIEERQPYAVLYTSLGCPYSCSFCCINSIFGGRGIRYRPLDNVMEEIDYLVKTYKMKNIKVLDEIFVMKEDRVIEFCDRIIERGYDLNFWVYGRINTVKESMLKKMKQAGINWIAYGIEAGSKKVRDGVTKGRFDQNAVYDIVKKTQEADIYVVGNFIFGLPDDDFETMQETLDMAKELNCEYTNIYCAMAYPGSQLYNEAIKQGIPLPPEWSGYGQFSVDTFPLPTKHLTGGQVLRFRDEAFDDYYNDPKYLNMVKEKFGEKTLENIKQMCSVKLKRKYIDYNEEVRFQSTN